MHQLSAGQASIWALLSLSSVFSLTAAWPTNNFHNFKNAKRQSSEDGPAAGEAEDEPVFNEEYDFIVAGGTLFP